jgi:hypothetical protein
LSVKIGVASWVSWSNPTGNPNFNLKNRPEVNKSGTGPKFTKFGIGNIRLSAVVGIQSFGILKFGIPDIWHSVIRHSVVNAEFGIPSFGIQSFGIPSFGIRTSHPKIIGKN